MTTVLIADDEAVDREQASRCLEPLEDVEILHARDGAEALEAVADRRPDVVLTDLRMPGMDGLKLVERLKEQYPLIPVVLMTSHGNEQIAVDALQAGAASYVPKDSLKEDLAETIEQVLELAKTQRFRQEVLKGFGSQETRFELANDISLISPLAGFLQGDLERLGLGDESLRTKVGVALMEALSNAIVHGNLEVDSQIRDRSLKEYYALIDQRRTQEPYASRRVRCTASQSTERIHYVIEDQGPGFDHASLPDATDPENVVRVRGRGLLLIRTFMDEVAFEGSGNRILMTKRFDD